MRKIPSNLLVLAICACFSLSEEKFGTKTNLQLESYLLVI